MTIRYRVTCLPSPVTYPGQDHVLHKVCPAAGVDNAIDFASRFPPRQLDAKGFEAKILELGIETMKIESGACDLPPEGTKEKSFGKFVSKFRHS